MKKLRLDFLLLIIIIVIAVFDCIHWVEATCRLHARPGRRRQRWLQAFVGQTGDEQACVLPTVPLYLIGTPKRNDRRATDSCLAPPTVCFI